MVSQVYEARDRIEPYGRLCAHLERMYEIVFEGEKLGGPPHLLRFEYH